MDWTMDWIMDSIFGLILDRSYLMDWIVKLKIELIVCSNRTRDS